MTPGRDRASLTDEIKEVVLSVGYDRVGVTTAVDFPFFREQVEARSDMYNWAIDSSEPLLILASPIRSMAAARSIIVTISDIAKEAFPRSMVGSFGRLFLARAVRGGEWTLQRIRNRLVCEFLEWRGVTVGKAVAVPLRHAAARAGLTTFGSNTFAFAQGIGSYICIDCFVVDAELDYDAPTFSAPCPDGCSRCLEACPTGALYEPFRMDPRHCIAYNSYAAADPARFGNAPAALPQRIRESMGRWIYGCDACQDACPRNRPRLSAALPPNEFLVRIAPRFSPAKLLNMSEEYFQRYVLPVFNYIPDKKYFQRNAAVALGNIRDPVAIPALIEAISNPEPLVRGHAAWALGRIGGAKARQALETAARRESTEEVRCEIEDSLARL